MPGQKSTHSNELLRKLQARRVFVPWGGGAHRPPLLTLSSNDLNKEADENDAEEEKLVEQEAQLPEGVEPLVLWDPLEDAERAVSGSTAIAVDPILTKFLRPHQRQGGNES